MFVLVFSTTFISNISPSQKSRARYNHKCVLVFIQSTRYSCQILIILEFSRQILEESTNIKFHQNIFQWQPSCSIRTDGQTDRFTVSFLCVTLFHVCSNAVRFSIFVCLRCQSYSLTTGVIGRGAAHYDWHQRHVHSGHEPTSARRNIYNR